MAHDIAPIAPVAGHAHPGARRVRHRVVLNDGHQAERRRVELDAELLVHLTDEHVGVGLLGLALAPWEVGTVGPARVHDEQVPVDDAHPRDDVEHLPRIHRRDPRGQCVWSNAPSSARHSPMRDFAAAGCSRRASVLTPSAIARASG